MGRKRKDSDQKFVVLRTRVPHNVYQRLVALVPEGSTMYMLFQGILVGYMASVDGALRAETYSVLADVACETGYSSVDALLQDLARAFLRVYRYANDELAEDESTPAEEIRYMFEDMESFRKYEQGVSIRKSPY